MLRMNTNLNGKSAIDDGRDCTECSERAHDDDGSADAAVHKCERYRYLCRLGIQMTAAEKIPLSRFWLCIRGSNLVGLRSPVGH